MQFRRIVKLSVGGLLLVAACALAYVTSDTWHAWLNGATPETQGDDNHAQTQEGETHQVKLSRQAQSNLHLVSKALKPETYWRIIEIPGIIVDRPAYSDRGVVTPATGVVSKVHRFAGDTVRPGDDLFTLRLLSETLHTSQSELFKTTQKIEINNEKKVRLVRLHSQGAVSEAAMLEVENQARRLATADKAYRQELQIRGLTPEQIAGVAAGKFVSELVVKAPVAGTAKKLMEGNLERRTLAEADDSPLTFEVQELKVDLGQQVQAGQTLALLSNHQSLYIEGRAFRDETALVEKTAKEGWPIDVEFAEKGLGEWPRLDQSFVVQHIANTIDPVNRTFVFYIPLHNQSRNFQKDEKTFMIWRFRPGQKVRLHLKVEKIDNVFVVPADAVVREGPDAFVFRQNGDLFDRKPVHVVYEDRQNVVLANDDSVPPGVYIAQNGATQINRVLKAQGGSPAGVHVHADGTVHANH